MLQTLNKQSKKKILRKLKLKEFFKNQLWQHLLVISFVVACAWLFDKYIEAVMFCIGHLVIRRNFDKQYHCETTALCMFTTLTIAFFGIASALPITVSILSTIPVCFFISWLGYIVQDRMDLIVINRKLKAKPQLTDKEVFIQECKNYRYNDLKTEIALRLFYHKQGIKEVWNWLCDTQENPPEYDSVKRMKYRIQKDLFKK